MYISTNVPTIHDATHSAKKVNMIEIESNKPKTLHDAVPWIAVVI
jgi:hypothetical protein